MKYNNLNSLLATLLLAVSMSQTAFALNWSDGITVYFDNSETQWRAVYIIIGRGDYSRAYPMEAVENTTLYKSTMYSAGENYTEFVIASSVGKSSLDGGGVKITDAYSTCTGRIKGISTDVTADILITIAGAPTQSGNTSIYPNASTSSFKIEQYNVPVVPKKATHLIIFNSNPPTLSAHLWSNTLSNHRYNAQKLKEANGTTLSYFDNSTYDYHKSAPHIKEGEGGGWESADCNTFLGNVETERPDTFPDNVLYYRAATTPTNISTESFKTFTHLSATFDVSSTTAFINEQITLTATPNKDATLYKDGGNSAEYAFYVKDAAGTISRIADFSTTPSVTYTAPSTAQTLTLYCYVRDLYGLETIQYTKEIKVIDTLPTPKTVSNLIIFNTDKPTLSANLWNDEGAFPRLVYNTTISGQANGTTLSYHDVTNNDPYYPYNKAIPYTEQHNADYWDPARPAEFTGSVETNRRDTFPDGNLYFRAAHTPTNNEIEKFLTFTHLSATFEVSSVSPCTNEKITLTATPDKNATLYKDGGNSAEYAFYVKDAAGKISHIADFSEKASATYTVPATAQTITLYCYVRDLYGLETMQYSKEIEVVAAPPTPKTVSKLIIFNSNPPTRSAHLWSNTQPNQRYNAQILKKANGTTLSYFDNSTYDYHKSAPHSEGGEGGGWVSADCSTFIGNVETESPDTFPDNVLYYRAATTPTRIKKESFKTFTHLSATFDVSSTTPFINEQITLTATPDTNATLYKDGGNSAEYAFYVKDAAGTISRIADFSTAPSATYTVPSTVQKLTLYCYVRDLYGLETIQYTKEIEVVASPPTPTKLSNLIIFNTQKPTYSAWLFTGKDNGVVRNTVVCKTYDQKTVSYYDNSTNNYDTGIGLDNIGTDGDTEWRNYKKTTGETDILSVASHTGSRYWCSDNNDAEGTHYFSTFTPLSATFDVSSTTPLINEQITLTATPDSSATLYKDADNSAEYAFYAKDATGTISRIADFSTTPSATYTVPATAQTITLYCYVRDRYGLETIECTKEIKVINLPPKPKKVSDLIIFNTDRPTVCASLWKDGMNNAQYNTTIIGTANRTTLSYIDNSEYAYDKAAPYLVERKDWQAPDYRKFVGEVDKNASESYPDNILYYRATKTPTYIANEYFTPFIHLSASFDVFHPSPCINEQITLTATPDTNATLYKDSGNGAEYAFYVKDAKGDSICISDFSTIPSVTYTAPSTEQSITLICYIRDLYGLETLRYSETIQVSKTPVSHTVSFNTQGIVDAPDAQTVRDKETATEPSAPTAAGYTFGGWYTDAACLNKYDFRTGVTADIILYAQWTGSEQDAYRLVYTEKDGGHVVLFHPSRVIASAERLQRDTLSMYVKPFERKNSGQNPHQCEVWLQQFVPSDNGTMVWETKQSIAIKTESATFPANGVYNFVLVQDGNDVSVPIADVHPYRGNYYIRLGLDANYRKDEKQFHFSDYASKYDDRFDHYFCRYKEGGKDVRFCVACDYSDCVSDTLVQEPEGDPHRAYTDENGILKHYANVRFMWNSENNHIDRDYIAIAGQNVHLLSEKGIYQSGSSEPATDVVLSDANDWVYQADITAETCVRVKLYVKPYTNASENQYLKGAAGDFSNANTIQLIGGTEEKKLNIRVMYDFKSNHLICAWLPEGNNPIKGELSLQSDLILIRETHKDAQQITFTNENAKITKVSKAYGIISLPKTHFDSEVSDNAKKFYWISFPYDVHLSEVFSVLTYGTDYVVKYYDGAERADKGCWSDSPSFWKMYRSTEGVTLHKGMGYLLHVNINNINRFFVNRNTDINIYFPSANKDSMTISGEIDTVNVPKHTCTIQRANRYIYDSNWNLIGVPTWANVNDMNLPGAKVIDGISVKFLYDYDPENNGYNTVDATQYNFGSMKAYMVQFAGTINWKDKSITPSPSQKPLRAPAAANEQTIRLDLLRGEEVLDHTFVQLSEAEGITDGFDLNSDLTKIHNSGSNLYTLIGSEQIEAAANILPYSEQTVYVPLGVVVDGDGTYTFSLPEEMEGMDVRIADAETGYTHNLLLSPYEVALTAGTYTQRFSLEIHAASNVTTGCSETGAAGERLRKLLLDGHLFIQRGEKVYDAQGRQIR